MQELDSRFRPLEDKPERLDDEHEERREGMREFAEEALVLGDVDGSPEAGPSAATAPPAVVAAATAIGGAGRQGAWLQFERIGGRSNGGVNRQER